MWAWCDLVGQHPPVGGDEHFHCQYAHQVEPFRHSPCQRLRARGNGLGDAGGGVGDVENMVAVVVLHRVEDRHRSVRAAGHDDADFAGEIDETLEDQRLGGEFGEAGGDVAGFAQQGLALAVVPRGGWF